MKTSPKGIRLICEFEGFRGDAYLCPAGVWTIGFGFTKGVRQGDVMTKLEAQLRLEQELSEYEQGVLRACKVPANQNQFDAFVCFAFNVGVKGMTGSTAMKAHNRGDKQSASRAFGLWNKAGGEVFAGLTRRRAAEAALYLEPVPDDVSDPVQGAMLPMPQAVDPERPMTASSINRAGLVAGGTATVATVSEVVNSVGYIKRGVADLEAWAVPLLLMVTIAAVGYIVWQRFAQRKAGLA